MERLLGFVRIYAHAGLGVVDVEIAEAGEVDFVTEYQVLTDDL